MAAKLTLPFLHLNLRFNPFGELESEDRARIAVVDVERFVQPLRNGGFAVQFLGDCGRGKSSHLHALRASFPDAPYAHLYECEKTALPSGPVVFVDDLDFLKRPRRFLRKCGALAATTHVDLSPTLNKAGFSVETVPVAGTDRLAEIIRRRIEFARRDPGPLPFVPAGEIRKLIDRFGDDIRAAEDHLYTIFQELREIGHVQV